MCKACDPEWKDKLGRGWNEAKSTDPCDDCGKPIKDCRCVFARHLCCKGSPNYYGHLADCPLFGKAT